MDSLIAAAARALAAGDPLSALQRVALRDDPAALALRGTAMAQLGELDKARELLRRAARGFGRHEQLAQARCKVAEAEVALALRDVDGVPKSLAEAVEALESRHDRANALHARLIDLRRQLLLGRLDDAREGLEQIDVTAAPHALVAIASLVRAELALRSLDIAPAREALAAAEQAARHSGVPALAGEVQELQAALSRPAARRGAGAGQAALRLEEVARLAASQAVVVDACRHGLRCGERWIPLATRPVLFAIACALAEAWPGDAGREALIQRVFRTRHPDETHRARLRVEVGRLRKLAQGVARIVASPGGFAFEAAGDREVVLLSPPIDGEQAALSALLSDGAAWTTSALALALGTSQRTVQRALADLEAAGRVRSVGRARSQRWVAPPLSGITTLLLLPAALPSG